MAVLIENTLNWQANVDVLGPWASLDILREALTKAPEEAKATELYSWLAGYVSGRAVHEELGGV